MIVAMAGGVGGAKLADGLARCIGTELTVIVNTGDDFEHLGLHISPDLDTVMYTLAGIANPATGWGIAGETWNTLEHVARLGGPDWFKLGDRDLATHILRTQRLRGGERLTDITAGLCSALGLPARVLPMSDDPVRTIVQSGADRYPFQDYFVRLKCAVPVTALHFEGVASARPSREVEAALTDPSLTAIVLCPSNPYLSIDPILAVPGMRLLIGKAGVPVVAVSPIIGGAAVKGPAAKIMAELGVTPSVTGIAEHYRGLIDGLMIDAVDADLAGGIEAMGIRVRTAPILMRTNEDRRKLAEECITFAMALAS
ncbi:MAG: 2-phospho-L-lactate transferase [Rhizobiales bacterium]|nr:2-phospho-L-lactate transferase [Hyphomicrobiales bacterium]